MWRQFSVISFLLTTFALKGSYGMTGPVVEGAKLNDGLVKSGMGYFVVTMNLPLP